MVHAHKILAGVEILHLGASQTRSRSHGRMIALNWGGARRAHSHINRHAVFITCGPTAGNEKRPVLVTGGAGFIGSHTCEALLRRGDEVVLVDNMARSSGDEELVKNNLDILRRVAAEEGNGKLHVVDADITNREKMAEAMRLPGPVGVGSVIHLAARAGVNESIEDPEAYIQTNVIGTSVMLGLAAEASCDNFIYGSSSNVYGAYSNTIAGVPPIPSIEVQVADAPVSPYAASKRMGELLTHTFHHLYKMPISVLRFFTVYGPRGRSEMAPYVFIDKISDGEEIVQYGDGSSWRDYTYVDDVVQGILKALDKPSAYTTYNISAGKPVMLSDFIHAVEKAVGKKARIRLDEDRKGDVSGTHGNISWAMNRLRYFPEVTLDDGLARTVAWYNTTKLQQQQATMNGSSCFNIAAVAAAVPMSVGSSAGTPAEYVGLSPSQIAFMERKKAEQDSCIAS